MKGHSSHALAFKGTHLSVYAILSRRQLHRENIPHPATSVVHRTCTAFLNSLTHLPPFLIDFQQLDFLWVPKDSRKELFLYTCRSHTLCLRTGSRLNTISQHACPISKSSPIQPHEHKLHNQIIRLWNSQSPNRRKDNRGSWSSQNAKCTQFSFKVPTVLNSSHTIE